MHDASVTSVSLNQGAARHLRTVEAGELDFSLFKRWITELVQNSGEDIFRMKGVVSIAHSKSRFVYHSVHMSFSGGFGEAWATDEPRESKLVFIGKQLDETALAEAFNACLATPENMKKAVDSLRFAIGTEVECNIEGKCHAGTVAELMCDPVTCARIPWVTLGLCHPLSYSTYKISTTNPLPDAPSHCASLPPPTHPLPIYPQVPLGRYRDDSMPDGMVAPYRVMFAAQGHFPALYRSIPADEEAFIRR